MEHFVKVVSNNVKVAKTLGQIEKIQMLRLWCNKALAFLNSFRTELAALQNCLDEQQRGLLIERCEALYMASVTTYLRCFHEQPSLFLKIKDITRESELLAEYAEIRSLRDDEFVHWKGINSSASVHYSLEVLDAKTVNFARNIQVNFSSSMKYFATETLERLYIQTLKYLEGVSEKKIENLRIMFHDAETWHGSDFVNPCTNQSVIKREN